MPDERNDYRWGRACKHGGNKQRCLRGQRCQVVHCSRQQYPRDDIAEEGDKNRFTPRLDQPGDAEIQSALEQNNHKGDCREDISDFSKVFGPDDLQNRSQDKPDQNQVQNVRDSRLFKKRYEKMRQKDQQTDKNYDRCNFQSDFSGNDSIGVFTSLLQERAFP